MLWIDTLLSRMGMPSYTFTYSRVFASLHRWRSRFAANLCEHECYGIDTLLSRMGMMLWNWYNRNASWVADDVRKRSRVKAQKIVFREKLSLNCSVKVLYWAYKIFLWLQKLRQMFFFLSYDTLLIPKYIWVKYIKSNFWTELLIYGVEKISIKDEDLSQDEEM